MERMDSRKKLFSNGSGLFNTTFFSASFLISCGLLTHGYSACWKPEKACIFVRSKIDLIYEEGRTLEECEAVIRRDVETQLGTRDIDLVFVSARRDRPVGIDVLNDVIMSKMNEARREKYILTAEARTKEQLEAKKAAAMTFVKRSATYSAYNGLNPIMLLMRLWIL